MKTLICYASETGTAEECANKLKQLIPNCDTLNLLSYDSVSLNDYQNIIVGASVRYGEINRKAMYFCHELKDALLDKKLGLYICCIDNDHADDYIANCYPKELVNHASAIGKFGGRLNKDAKMGIFDKFIMKFAAKKLPQFDTQDNLSAEAIKSFADEFIN